MPILAYSSEGKFNGDQKATINSGLKYWLSSTTERINSLKKEKFSPDSIASKEWRKYATDNYKLLGGRIETNSNCMEWYTIGQYKCVYSSYTRGPLFSTTKATWGQGGYSSYNSPSSSCDCGKDPAGCGPVAMAQVLRHYEAKYIIWILFNASFFK